MTLNADRVRNWHFVEDVDVVPFYLDVQDGDLLTDGKLFKIHPNTPLRTIVRDDSVGELDQLVQNEEFENGTYLVIPKEITGLINYQAIFRNWAAMSAIRKTFYILFEVSGENPYRRYVPEIDPNWTYVQRFRSAPYTLFFRAPAPSGRQFCLHIGRLDKPTSKQLRSMCDSIVNVQSQLVVKLRRKGRVGNLAPFWQCNETYSRDNVISLTGPFASREQQEEKVGRWFRHTQRCHIIKPPADRYFDDSRRLVWVDGAENRHPHMHAMMCGVVIALYPVLTRHPELVQLLLWLPDGIDLGRYRVSQLISRVHMSISNLLHRREISSMRTQN